MDLLALKLAMAAQNQKNKSQANSDKNEADEDQANTKPLKCPKCNWHYKYKETLDAHLREKHSDDYLLLKAKQICHFCQTGSAHPKLSRGESYPCGHKPYTCNLCNYSTTSKGNLTIHMQSDKHMQQSWES